MIEQGNGCALLNAVKDNVRLASLLDEGHVHIIVRSGEGYQAMIDASAARRTGTSDEIAEAAAFLLGEHARFITGTDLLIDGGVIASIRTGEFKLRQ